MNIMEPVQRRVTYPYLPFSAEAKNVKLFFDFEDDFVEQNVRCIPMIVRFKLDACGIKLQLREWSMFSIPVRTRLMHMRCNSLEEVERYRQYLEALVIRHTGAEATALRIDKHPAWADCDALPAELEAQLGLFNWRLSIRQWQQLNNLQRFVLMKLCKPGHENRNFPRAVREFGLS